jgi:hypothetical protein
MVVRPQMVVARCSAIDRRTSLETIGSGSKDVDVQDVDGRNHELRRFDGGQTDSTLVCNRDRRVRKREMFRHVHSTNNVQIVRSRRLDKLCLHESSLVQSRRVRSSRNGRHSSAVGTLSTY